LAEHERTKNLSAADRKLVTEGAVIFKQLCSSCHGPDGRGIIIGGKPMPAPPLVGSPRVKGDKTALIQLLMYGLKGPVDGKTYPDMMPAMHNQNDAWIASVLSYIRNSGELSNNASVVTPEEVKQVRETTPNMSEAFTLQLLEIFKLGRAEKKNWGQSDSAHK
jgi:mono/diheme cytochrome c family protein